MIEQQILGFTSEGEVVIGYTITNVKGAKVSFINIGAAITTITVPDKNGDMISVLHGHDDYNDYFKDTLQMGRIVGRYSGRIAKGRFSIGETPFKLSANDTLGHLNGGISGFQSKIWTSRVEGELLVMSYISPSGEEGYPSEFGIEVGYDWSDDNTLGITIVARGEGDTIANIVPHLWFNLNGEESGTTVNHNLTINANRYAELNTRNLPTGAIKEVIGTPMNFTVQHKIGDNIDADFDNMTICEGYDSYWLTDDRKVDQTVTAAILKGDISGITMTVSTSQPAIYLSVNALTEGAAGRNDRELAAYDGVMLTTGNLPDAPNQAKFPCAILKAGDMYHHYTSYKFK